MSNYDNKNSFVLFKNDKQGNEKAPDYTGKLEDENGKQWRIAAWIKEGQKGKFMSGKISEFQPASGNSSQAPASKPAPAPQADTEQWDTDLPF